jgi:hypothetical protein
VGLIGPLGTKGEHVMEISTLENEAIVRSICEAVSADRESGKSIKPDHQRIYDIDFLLMEANSGASFEQYFRWASVEEIGRVVPALRAVGLPDMAELTEKAILVAFPKGIPSTDEEKTGLTDWSAAQDEKLRELFPAFEDQNGRITNVLAAFASRR